ncbi:MAG: penicillin-binding protein 2, partial [Actinomycetota bacterium]|nr:penicillin-binding protein 2 [Actinomycetota bacterium]
MNDRSTLRLIVVRVLIVSLLATLGGRLWYLQVLAADDFTTAAADNRIREIVTAAPRGTILDATGHPLVRNRTALVVSVSTAALSRQADGGDATLGRLSALIKISADDLRRRVTPCGKGVPRPCWNGSPLQPVPVLGDASPQVALRIAEHQEDFPGVSADFQAVREYPDRTLAAHTLGYLAPVSAQQLKSPQYAGHRDTDLVGVAGLEEQYDRRLSGTAGLHRVAVDHAGRVTATLSQTDPVRGGDLVTNLDLRVQALAEKSLLEGLLTARKGHDKYGRPYQANSGAVVVLDAKTGAVLALASYPSYDPSVWTGGIATADYAKLTGKAAGVPLISRATQGEFAPGSTFKLVSSSAAVRGGYPLTGTYQCPGVFRVGSASFTNFEAHSYGPMDLRKALIKSCDTVFYNFGYQMWLRDGGLEPAKGQAKELFARTAQAYGFGATTGLDLPEEAAGRIPDRADKLAFWTLRKADYCAGANNPKFDALHRQLDREFCVDGYAYRAGDAVNFAIGQGDVLVTPLQLATAYAAMANGGTVYRPQVGKAVLGPGGAVTWRAMPKAARRLPLDKATLNYIRSAMAGVTRPGGTAYGAFTDWPQDRIPVGGKTGTAEVGLTKTGRQDTSWFAAFAPANDPQFVVVNMLEQVGTGGAYAAKVVRRVLNGIYGVSGQPAIYPTGRIPAALPRMRPDGTVAIAPASLSGGGGATLSGDHARL